MDQVEGAYATADGGWRVEVVRSRQQRWYRVTHGRTVWDKVAIGSVERILRESGIDMGTLMPANDRRTA